MEVNQAFTFQGDGMHNSALLLPDLINEGVRLLVYAGNADAMCNYIGNERWVNELETKFTSEFQATTPLPWVTLKGGKVAGVVRAAGGGGVTAGNVTFVTVYEVGLISSPLHLPLACLPTCSSTCGTHGAGGCTGRGTGTFSLLSIIRTYRNSV
jgi:carboxypeptidase C (cathepsin A)